MKTEFCEVETRAEAFNMCPWACVCVEVYGGYMCFESSTDYQTWEAQE